MIPSHGALAASFQGQPWTAPEWLWPALALLGLTLAVAMAFALGRASRRALFASSREIIRAAEEIAEGRFERLPAFAADDPLAPAAAALAKLSMAVRGRTQEVERRHRVLEDILASAHETALLLTDFEGHVRYASPGAERLFGWKSGEGQGEKLESLFAGEDLDAILPKLSRKSLKEGVLQHLQHRARLVGGDGEIFNADLIVTAFRNLPGGGEGFLLEIRDLRGEESLRGELRLSEEKHRTLAEKIPFGVFLLQKGRIVFANRALEEMLKVPGGLVGREFRDHLASEDLLRVLDKLQKAEAGKEASFEIDCRMLPADTRWPIEVSLSASRIEVPGGPAVMGTVRDLGPDRGLLRQIRLSEAKLDAALGASEEAHLLLSEAPSGGTVTLVGRRFEELFGIDSRTLTGLSLSELTDRLAPLFADPVLFRRYLRQFEAPIEASVLAEFETAGTTARTIEFSSRVAHDRSGRRIGRLLSARDITSQKEHERHLNRESEELARARDLLEQANRELEEVNRELSARSADVEKANLQLHTLDEMKSNLLANVSHELQTPLVSIKGYTEMILRGRLGAVTEEQKKGLEVSLRNIDRLIGMINNLLNFSRIERDMAGLKITTFTLPEVVEEAIELVREVADERRISLTSRYLIDDLLVKADREKISQVFINLLSNAVKYNRDGGMVQVDVRKGKKGYLIVDVRDTGIGIPRESLEKVFDRHYRVPAEAPSTAAGSGIGLAIVRDVLRMHGCIIKADSALGEGSVFTFTLPVAAVDLRESQGHGGAEPSRGAEPSGDPLRAPLPSEDTRRRTES